MEEDEHEGVFANVFATLTNILVFCSPNSQEDRVENMGAFFTQTQGDSNQSCADESLTKFAKRVVEKARRINGQYSTPQISQEQIYSTIINGVKKGSQKEAYAEALNALKFNVQSSRAINIKSTVLWLYRKCDHTKLPAPGSQSSSAANYRGGGSRGGGRGRGGRGRGGRGRGPSSNSNPGPQVPIGDGSPTWKDTMYAVTNGNGEDQVAKEIKERKSSQPCFKLITGGKCPLYEKGKCPYNHEFNIVDTRQNRGNSSSSSGSQVSQPDVQPALPPVTQRQPPTAPTFHTFDTSAVHTHNVYSDNKNNSDTSSTNSDSSTFDYAYDLGFSHKSSAAASVQSSGSLSHLLSSTLSTLTNTDSLYDCLHFVFMLWFLLFSLPYILSSSISFCSNVCSLCVWSCENSVLILSVLLRSIGMMIGNIFCATKSIGSYCNIFSPVYRPHDLNFNSSTDFFLPLCILFGLVVACVRLTRTSPLKHLVFGAGTRQAIYQIILDCGCTFNMSGDRSIFIESSLVPIYEEVGLAESGKMSVATHKGKMVVDGKVLDGLFVPDFKQTMISMGQLERMGLVYCRTAQNVRSFLTEKGDIFLSFCAAPNNLYPLLPRNQSASAGKTSQDSS